MISRILMLAALFLLVITIVYLLLAPPPVKTYLFPNVNGPQGATVVAPKETTPWQHYERGAPNALAILLTDEQSSWLGLAHGLKSIGVPFCITRNYEQALTHRVVIVYPALTGRSLPPEGLRSLTKHVQEGGTLIGFGVEGGGMPEIFRFGEVVPSRTRTSLSFSLQPLVAEFLQEPNEKSIRLGIPGKPKTSFPTVAFQKTLEPPLAIFDDGLAAITQSSWGRGHAYAFGLDVGHLLLRGSNGRYEELGRSYVNGYEPTVDVFLRLLRHIYQAGEPDGVVMHTVPFNKRIAVIITHDVDFTRSVPNAISYAEFERSQGITATYFIQTKYVRDYNDEIFFNAEALPALKRLNDLGMEIASHGVSHAKTFVDFSLGNGKEHYPDYTPFVKSITKASNGTILGELRVSKFLLEHFTGQEVVSFRPGHLSMPKALPQALQGSGYRFGSTLTANSALSHLPMRCMFDQEYAMELNVFEFPVTIEDEELPKMGDRVPQALVLSRQIGRYGGLVNVLIHPDVLDHKLDFEKRFVTAVKPEAWFGSVKGFGQWWVARNEVNVEVATQGRDKVIRLAVPTSIEGLTLELPHGWSYRSCSGDVSGVRQNGRRLLLGHAKGNVALVCTVAL